MIVEINRCVDSLRNTSQVDEMCDPNMEYCEIVDPPCASETDIDRYIERKQARFEVINNKINFEIDKAYLRQSEI